MFLPEVTVACVITYQDKFLLVQEYKRNQLKINNPAGHLEQNESLIEACQREVLEETGLAISPHGFIGSYLAPTAEPGKSYLRFCFYYEFTNPPPQHEPQDSDIDSCVWLTYEQLKVASARHRSDLVLKCIDDFKRGQRGPLSLVQYCPDKS
ncbi:NUDIX hydrolase [Corallincola platygyrae]|uniref:Phosphatase NudJ n=1 Tax=Corallincola platygyrae TaxID=1193278 RepID=A0ABW4XGN7_9GAMM